MTTDNDFFEEVAKFRATRRLWARLARERYDTDDPRVLGLKITTFTGAHRLTAQQPLNNVTRTSVHVLASLLGGVERISTPGHDEALALPTEESTRVANLTKMIALYELGAGTTVDPLGGSYYVEHLTDVLEQSAEEIYRRVDEQGGAVAAIEAGMYEQAMVQGAVRNQAEIESGERPVVGVNTFEVEEELTMALFDADEAYQQEQVERLRELRARRDSRATTASLDQLADVLGRKRRGDPVNSVPAFGDCVRARATFGEIAGVMREQLDG